MQALGNIWEYHLPPVRRTACSTPRADDAARHFRHLPPVFATNRRPTATTHGSVLCAESCSGFRWSAMTQDPPPLVPRASVGPAPRFPTRVHLVSTTSAHRMSVAETQTMAEVGTCGW